MNVSLVLLELVLAAAALGVMTWDLFLPAGRKGVLAWAAMGVCVVLFALSFLPDVAAGGTALGSSFRADGLSLLLKRAFAVTGFLVFLMSREYVDEMPRGQGEFYTIGLFALLGMFLVSSVNDFMSLFVSLEVVTVSFFVLCAFKRDNRLSVEAGLKLLVIGSLSAAIQLYGIAFIYGATGTTSFDAIRAGLADGSIQAGRLELIVGAILLFLGLGFKTSAVPLHVWVPDVYQGAPTPVTAYLSVGSKLAGFVLVIRCLQVFTAGGVMTKELSAFFALVAALTLLYGNLGAIPQTNIKRLMGYSSIGQCGYILVGIAAMWATGLSGALFYMSAYVVTNLAAFAVILIVSRATGSHELDDYSGLARRSPMLAIGLTCALLSLAGVPPFIGFFGKFMLLGAAFAKPELLWLGAVGLLNVVIALYYYLCICKRLYVHEPRSAEPLRVPMRMRVALVLSCALLVFGGIAPQFLERTASRITAELQFPASPK